MGKQFRKFLAALLASVTVLALFPAGMITDVSAAESAPAAEGTGFYKVSGTQILDGDGNPVVMKGISFGNAHYGNIYTSVEIDEYGHGVRNDHDADSFFEVADMGLDHVRFEFNYGLFEDDDNVGVYKQSGFDWIDENIAWAKAAGIRLILQMKSPQGGYQNATDTMYGKDDGGKALWIDIDQQNGTVLTTENYKKNQERLINLWKAIADHYKDEPTIIGYGLLNEPAVPQKETAAETVGQWKDLAQGIADAIRTVDNNHILFVERMCSYFDPNGYDKTNWNLVPTADAQFKIDDSNTVYEFHFYEPLKYTHQGAGWLTETYGDCYYDGTSIAEMEMDYAQQGSSNNALMIPNGEWTYFESEPFTKGDNYNIAQPRVSMASIPGNSSIWVDDLKITRTKTDGSDGSEATVLSYDFSKDVGGFFKVWNGDDDNNAIRLDPTVGHDALGSMKLTNNLSGEADQWANAQSWDNVALEEGYTYKISGYVKGGTNDCYPKVDFYHADNVWLMNKDYLEHLLNEYIAFSSANNVPMHVGEWGFHVNCYDKGAEQYTKDLTELFAKYGLSCNYHSYHDATFALYLSEEFEERPERNDTLYGYLTQYYCDPLKTLTITPDSTEIVEGTEQTVTFTAAAAGNSGEAVRIPYIKWTYDPAEAPAGVTYNEDGSVSVSAEAKPCEITVTATSGAGSDEAVVTVTGKPAQTPTTITISRGDGVKTTDTLVIPASGETVYTYTAAVTDQEDKPIESPEIDWSLETEDDFVTQEGGSVTVKAGATNDKTYTLKAVCGEATAQVEITLKGLTVTWPQVTENSPEYGKKLSEMLALSGGSAMVNGETVEGTFTLNSADSVPDAGKVSYTINFKSTDEEYNIDSEEHTVTVAPKPITVTVQEAARVYGAENPAFDFTVPDGALVGQDTKEGLGLTLGTEANAASDVGSYAVTKAAQTTTNYEVTVASNTALTVTAKELTASLTGSVTKVYDKTTSVPTGHSLQVALDGVVNDDELTASAAFAYDDAAVGTGKSVTASDISVTGDKSKNYTLRAYTASAALGEITAKELTASLNGTATKEYDGTTVYNGAGVTVKLEGVINDDTVTAAPGALTFDSADPGDNKTLTAADVTLSGEDAGNYTVKEEILTVTGSITKATVAAKDVTMNVTNHLAKTYEFDLAALLPEITTPKTLGTVTYELGAVSITNTAYAAESDVQVGGTKLTVAVKDVVSDVEGEIGTVQVTIKSENYNDMTATVTISAVNKAVVDITGVTKADATYDGTAHTGYTGAPAAEGFTGEFEIAYTGEKADGTPYSDTAAPVDAGTYTVTFTVPATDPQYTGSGSVQFTIAKKQLTWGGGFTASKQQDVTGETVAYGDPVITGLVGSDKLTVTDTAFKTSGFDAKTEPGEYEVEVVPADGTWTFEPAEPINYILPQGNPKATAVVNKVDKVEIEEGDDELRLEVESGLSQVPAELAGNEALNTPEKITQALVEAVRTANSSIEEKNTVTYDVTLQIKKEDSTWEDVTSDNFPEDGVLVTLDYPAGTNSGYRFTVIHMITVGADAGKTETPAVTNGERGISFRVMSLSPICVGWSAPAAPGFSGGGGGGGTSSRPVTLPESTPNGSVTSNFQNAVPNSTVTLTVKPDKGYVLGELTVTDGDGKAVALKDNGDGTYSFTMPNTGVTVTAVFKCAGGETCPSRKFTDLDAKAWYHEYTDYVITNGLMQGGGSLFDPNGTVTRAQMVTVLWNMRGKPVVNYYMTYSDVSEDAWYAEAIRWAASEEVVDGYGNGLFGPDDPITREQMATMLYRYEKKYGSVLGGEQYALTFTDAAKVSPWAQEAVTWCAMNGIITGKDNNIFDPSGNAQRCELAAVLTRYSTKDAAGE